MEITVRQNLLFVKYLNVYFNLLIFFFYATVFTINHYFFFFKWLQECQMIKILPL